MVEIWKDNMPPPERSPSSAHLNLGHAQMFFMFAYKAEPKSTTKPYGYQAVKHNSLVY
jgi:hypothetical protein